jgi:hypothetical protein
MNANQFETHAFLELMGHRKLAGLVQEVEIAGGKFLRIDVPDDTGKITTQFYSPSSIYCITPTTEAMVAAWAHNNAPKPVGRFELDFPKTETETPGYSETDINDD